MYPRNLIRLSTAALILALGSMSTSRVFGQGPKMAVLPAVRAEMEKAIAAREVAGAVTLVAGRDGIKHLDAAGYANMEAKQAMSADNLFWIASMTKPVTGVAILILQEDGKLDIHDPVSKYIPEFAQVKNANGESVSLTLLQLMTHTSGLVADVNRMNGPGGKPMTRLADMVPAVVAAPLRFAPNSKWEYCQSGINMLGRVVEVVSGKSFPDFVDQRICQPLGMKDTTFYPTAEQATRLVTTYQRTTEGDLTVTDLKAITQGLPVTDHNRVPLPNAGLFSTAGDYARFARMLLRGGELDGTRILKAESVKQMSTVHTDPLETGFTPGNGWGLTVCIVKQPQGVTATLSPGTYGHGGKDGTQAWIDPAKDTIYILMVARSNFRNADGSDIRAAFQKAAAESLAR